MLKDRFLANKSLATNLQVLVGAVVLAFTAILVTGYSYFSSHVGHEERTDSARALGTTLSRLVARPISLGDYLSVEQALRGSSLQSFVCAIQVVTPNGATVASTESEKSSLCTESKEAMTATFPIVTTATLDPAGEQQIGKIVLKIALSDLRTAQMRNVCIALFSGAALALILLVLSRTIVDLAIRPLGRAVSAASSDHPEVDRALEAAPTEIQPLLSRLMWLSTENAKADGDIRVAKVARQVAHDIRSPLAALEMSGTSKNIPESERVMIRQATTRIRDIANDLSGRFREAPAERSSESAVESAQLIPVLIDEIVTEMRLRYRSKANLEISANLDESNYGLFAVVDPTAFRRSISNLIQNAVEAVIDGGKVEVRSLAAQDKVIIKISDNGVGIPADIRPRLGVRGETFGKANGSGLGLHYARQMAEGCGGLLSIDSTVMAGTTVSIELPIASEPDWFVPRLELEQGSCVVVLDDDQSIHQIWSERLSQWVGQGAIELLHFAHSPGLRDWFRANEDRARGARYLVDYELIDEEDTGLSLIQELGIEKNATLITSHYDESRVRVTCDESQIRMIPKGLAAFVPIQVDRRGISAVLIDDDPLTHSMWSHVAEQFDQRVFTFFNDSELDAFSLPLETPVYVDRNLGYGPSGETILKRLHAKGFANLFLFTGDKVSQDELSDLSFLKGVVGKAVPQEVYGRA